MSLLDLAKAQEAVSSEEDKSKLAAKKPSLLKLAQSQSQFSFVREPPPDISLVGAFGAGLKTGLLDPFRILGASPRIPVLDETTEKAANLLGSFVGLGISFIPFSIGVGAAMKGFGLLRAADPRVFAFAKNIIAGSAQFAGSSEEMSQVPGNVIKGAAFGAAFEGLILGFAMRGRAKGVTNVPDNPVSIPVVEKEMSITPGPEDTPERITFVLGPEGLGRVEPTPPRINPLSGPLPGIDPIVSGGPPIGSTPRVRSSQTQRQSADFSFDEPGREVSIPEPPLYDRILTNLAGGNFVTSVRLNGLGAEFPAVIAYAKSILPNAQIASRSLLRGVKELFIHNPFDPSERLSVDVLDAWIGRPDLPLPPGFEVLYNTKTGEKSFMLTGARVAEGRVQIQDPFNKGIVFAPKLEDVKIPVEPKYYSDTARKRGLLAQAVTASDKRVGFAVSQFDQSTMTASVRRGVVDITEFEPGTLREFTDRYRGEILAMPNVKSAEEALQLFTARRGIKGLVEREEGLVTKIHVFDQTKVSFIDEVPSLGVVGDNVTMGSDGQSVISLIPSWKNKIMHVLKGQNLTEAEINGLVDAYEIQLANNLESTLLDPQMKGIIESARFQFQGGC